MTMDSYYDHDPWKQAMNVAKFSACLQVYQCITTHNSQQESVWIAKFMDHLITLIHVHIATEVIQLPHSKQH